MFLKCNAATQKNLILIIMSGVAVLCASLPVYAAEVGVNSINIYDDGDYSEDVMNMHESVTGIMNGLDKTVDEFLKSVPGAVDGNINIEAKQEVPAVQSLSANQLAIADKAATTSKSAISDEVQPSTTTNPTTPSIPASASKPANSKPAPPAKPSNPRPTQRIKKGGIYDVFTDGEITLLFKTVETECHDASYFAKKNVASVIFNRFDDSELTLKSILTSPGQFAHSKKAIDPDTEKACEDAFLDRDRVSEARYFRSGERKPTFSGQKLKYYDGYHWFY